MKNFKNFFALQIVVLAAGTVFAWYTVYTDFVRFYVSEGTIFKIKDCLYPNPVTTPCFYGAWAFLAALVWSIVIFRMESAANRAKQQLYLIWFLVAGNLFAWSNFVYGLGKFYAHGGGPSEGCSGVLVTNPFTTPCFYGAVLFLLSLIVAATLYLYASNITSGRKIA